jgi:hypothetical protein
MTAKQKYTDMPEEETALIANARREGGVAASEESKYLVELFASVKERMWKPDLDLETIRDIVEHLQLAATEPEAVTYTEVDAGGVPALWCIPEGSDANRVLLHSPTVAAQLLFR